MKIVKKKVTRNKKQNKQKKNIPMFRSIELFSSLYIPCELKEYPGISIYRREKQEERVYSRGVYTRGVDSGLLGLPEASSPFFGYTQAIVHT